MLREARHKKYGKLDRAQKCFSLGPQNWGLEGAWAPATPDLLLCVLYSAIHKAVISLQCYSQSHWPHISWLFHNLTGTIPQFH